jgi:hypothetical protein
MKKRYTVFGLSVFLAIALAVPAFGGPSNPVAHTASALSKAKKAITLANNAQNTANTANGTANTALTTANQAKSAAAAAQTSANSAQTAANNANANANNRIATSVQRAGTTIGPDTNTSKGGTAACNTGEVVLGGGFFTSGTDTNVTVDESDRAIYVNGWFVNAHAFSGTPSWSLTPEVMCGQK